MSGGGWMNFRGGVRVGRVEGGYGWGGVKRWGLGVVADLVSLVLIVVFWA